MKQYRTLLLALLAVLALTVCALADGEEGETVPEVISETVYEPFPNLDATEYLSRDSYSRNSSGNANAGLRNGSPLLGSPATITTYDNAKAAIKAGLLQCYSSSEATFQIMIQGTVTTESWSFNYEGSSHSKDDFDEFLNRAYMNTVYNNPQELFFAQTGYSANYSASYGTNVTITITVTPLFFTSAQMAQATYTAAFNQALDECFGSHNTATIQANGMTDFERVLVVHDWIVNNCIYDPQTSMQLEDEHQKEAYNRYVAIAAPAVEAYNASGKTQEDIKTYNDEIERAEKARDDYLHGLIYVSSTDSTNFVYDPMVYTSWGVLVNRKAVCQGYSLTMKALLNAAGVQCAYVSSEKLSHAWNKVRIKGIWYQIDATWDDPSNYCDYFGMVFRNYFICSDSEFGHDDGQGGATWTTEYNNETSTTTFSARPAVLAAADNDFPVYHKSGYLYYVTCQYSNVSPTLNKYAVGNNLSGGTAATVNNGENGVNAVAFDYTNNVFYLRGNNNNVVYSAPIGDSPIAAETVFTATADTRGLGIRAGAQEGEQILFTTKDYVEVDKHTATAPTSHTDDATIVVYYPAAMTTIADMAGSKLSFVNSGSDTYTVFLACYNTDNKMLSVQSLTVTDNETTLTGFSAPSGTTTVKVFVISSKEGSVGVPLSIPLVVPAVAP